jgi:sugar lactone lactonase YvrE
MKNIPCTLRAVGLALTATLLVSVLGENTLLAAGGDLYLSDTTPGNIEQATPTSNGSTEGDFATALQGPYGLAFDKGGNLFVDNSGAGTIVKIAPDGSKSTFASEPGRLNGMAFDANGNLFVADYDHGSIDYLSPKGTRNFWAFGLNQPAGLVIDHSGNLYVTERGANVVTKYTGGIRSVFTSGLVAPTGLAIDDVGVLYVVEENGALYKLAANGSKSAPIASGFGGATAVAIDATGNIYVAENAKAGFKSAVTERIKPDGSRGIFTASNQNLQALAVAPTGHLLNISTRATIQGGDNVLIAGFITTGNSTMGLLMCGIGPSLTGFGVTNALQDPTIELTSGGASYGSNDNWKDDEPSQIQATGLAPTDNRESAILKYINPGAYTTIERGKNNVTGIGLVEVYNLNTVFNSEVANLSTRGFVGTGDNALIAGFIIGGGEATILVRAIGPSLTAFGVSGALQDPTLTVRDANGFPVGFDNDWKQHQQAQIQATGIAPKDDRESACLINLAAGSYTALVSGVGDTTGVGLVEVYRVK